jgi:hypothetical protein
MILGMKYMKKKGSRSVYYTYRQYNQYKWEPVTMALHILSLQMEEWPPIWMVAGDILNKQSRTADKGRYSSLGVG